MRRELALDMAPEHVGLITLGGTIATTKQSAPFPCLDGRALLERAGLSREEVTIEDLRLLRGSRLDMKDLTAVIQAVRRMIADRTIAAVVITTGTATLEELAFLLVVTVPAAKPVVVTGAARLVDDDSWDGARNLCDAFTMTRQPIPDLRGVTIAFGGNLHSPLLARKAVHGSRLIIESPPLGPMGSIDKGAVELRYAPIRLRYRSDQSPIRRGVVIWTVGLADSGDLLALLRQGIDGIVLVGFPGLELGLPEPVLALARELLDREKLVAYASRCGELCSAAVLREEPRLFVSAHLTPTKLRLLIMTAHGRADFRRELQEALKQVDEDVKRLRGE